MKRFMIFQLLVIIPFFMGVFAKRFFSDPKKISRGIINFNLALCEPAIALWSIWGLSLVSGLVFLPLAGLSLVIAGFIIGKALVPALGLSGRSGTTYIISSSLANHGYTMGSFLCFLFMGEKGIGLSTIFILYFIPYTYAFIFSYARSVSGKEKGRGIRSYALNLQNAPLYAAGAALVLQGCGIGRPAVNFPLDAVMAFSVAMYYFTLGINFNFSGMKIVKPEQLALAATKFLVIPAAAFFILGITALDREVKSVIILQSFMPAAIYSVVSAVLFDLDTKLASNLFVVNTAVFIAIVLPLLFVLKNIGIILL